MQLGGGGDMEDRREGFGRAGEGPRDAVKPNKVRRVECQDLESKQLKDLLQGYK